MMSPKRLEEMKRLAEGFYDSGVPSSWTCKEWSNRLAGALKDALAEIEELQKFNDTLVAKISEMAVPRLEIKR